MDEKQLIAQNTAEINRLENAVKHLNSSKTRAAGKAAAAQFHASYSQLFYPGCEERLKALRVCDEVAITTALNFLEVDPYYFRSGYTKEYIWKYIARCSLAVQDINRLCAIALRYLEQPVRRDFWYMCRAMTHLASDDFWQQVQARLSSGDPAMRTRASHLYAYAHGVEAGERVRMQARHESRHLNTDAD
ncbi:hypothetical protein TFLX_00912 [Thermoflexales bacterium]|nr:hypothetical protein TFLX_00912 [Thermoflexales bacterium]